MKLNTIELRNFRNYEQLNLSFSPDVNLIVGDNAQGKTNLLEAIAFLGSGRSFRTQKNNQLVKLNEEYAEMIGDVTSQERQQQLRWIIFSTGRPRQLYRNGIKQKSSGDISGVLQSVLFCPEDLSVIKAGAAARRRLGDSALCQLRPNYESALSEYNRILEQKSQILKDHFENPAMLQILPEYNTRLCQVGALIISYRARFYESLGKLAKKYHEQFSSGKEDFLLEYKTVSTVKNAFAPISVLTEELQEHLQSHSRAELESCQCLTGPHKDDFYVSLSELSLKDYGSQGQTRTAAISLKLAQRELMAKEMGQMPILLLDDVLSELDAARQEFILHQISEGQVFISCCEPEKFIKNGKTIEISYGKAVAEC